MKQLIVLIGALLMSMSSFAGTQSLDSLGSVWKSYKSAKINPGSNDLTMVYGGADISRKPTIAFHTATA